MDYVRNKRSRAAYGAWSALLALSILASGCQSPVPGNTAQLPVTGPAIDTTVPIEPVGAEATPAYIDVAMPVSRPQLVAAQPVVSSEPHVYAPPDPRGIPLDLKVLPELNDQRTDHSATFRNKDGSYTSIVSSASMHYLDSRGNWQAIDPSFQPTENGFIIDKNSIKSKVGSNIPTIAASAGGTMLNWQASEAGITTNGQYAPFANALTSATNAADLRDSGRTLHYANTWTDKALAEEIRSAPDQIEQSLIFNSAPAALATVPHDQIAGAYVDVKATLKLLPNTSLWADGQLQTGDFHTTGAIEIHNSAGQLAARVDSAAVYEQTRNEQAVPAAQVEYVATRLPVANWKPQPGISQAPQAWAVSIRTPLAWWLDKARHYPVVVDPTVRVLQSTGNGTGGLGWVGYGSMYPGGLSCRAQICDTQDDKLRFNGMLIGSQFGLPPYAHRGYFQFNQMPWLMARSPVSVSNVILEIQPSATYAPGYRYSGDDPGWADHKTQKDAHLYGLPCPAQCSGFSLTSAQNGWTWQNLPAPGGAGVVDFSTDQVFAPAIHGPNKGVKGAAGKWDVTNFVRAWAQKSPRPADGPMFMVQAEHEPSKSSSPVEART